MTYTIQGFGCNNGWRYRVILWRGRVAYVGNRTYARLQDAEKAAKLTGATERAR